MPEIQTQILELMREGINKINDFLDQIPDEFFGIQDSSKENLKSKARQIWESNPYQTIGQVTGSLPTIIENDVSCPDANALNQILFIGFKTDFIKPDLSTARIFPEATPDDLEPPFYTKGSGDIN